MIRNFNRPRFLAALLAVFTLLQVSAAQAQTTSGGAYAAAGQLVADEALEAANAVAPLGFAVVAVIIAFGVGKKVIKKIAG